MSAFPTEPKPDDDPGADPEPPLGAPDADALPDGERGVAQGEPAPLDPDDTEH